MKVPCRWLAEYVDIEVSKEEVARLAERLTLAGLEVEGITPTGRVHGAVVGRVLSHRPHPNSDHLSLCLVDIGTGEVEVVCGAANVVEGATVPVVTVGGELPGGLKVKERKVRGIASHGMICSRAELGLEQSSSGIWNFETDLKLVPGIELNDLLEFDDYVLDVKVTSNRPDCMGIYGIAREVAAIINRPLRPLAIDSCESEPPTEALFAVEVENATDTPRYGVRLMSNLITGPSPLRMQHRLLKAGMRPLLNVVDVTNYAMLELGQPLHPFDADLVGKRIVVRRARKGERFRTLDGVKRSLSEEVLMITDSDGRLAIAGVMGGERSEIKEGTTRVLLEAAAFDPITVRHSARSVGIRSEASQRFERGVDPEGIPQAAARTAHLLQELTGCQVHRGMVDSHLKVRKKTTIRLRPSRLRALLGIDINRSQVTEILKRLKIEVAESENDLIATVPTFRADLTREVDLIEEVGRIHGYDRLPSTPPQAHLQMGKKDPMELYKDRVRTILTGLGLSEVVTDGFDNAKWRRALSLPDEDLVAVRNPMISAQGALRGSLLPGILAVVETNINHRVDGGMLFEIGRVFLKNRGEVESLAGALFGRTGIPLHGKEEFDLLAAKGILTSLSSSLNSKEVRVVADEVPTFLHPGRGGRILLDAEPIGLLGEVALNIYDLFPACPRVILFELDIEKLYQRDRGWGVFNPLPRFPACKRDLCLLVPINLPEKEVRKVIRTEAEIEHTLLYDLYQGEQVASGYKSLTYEVSLRAMDRTLTDEEVATIIARIEKRLKKLGVTLRG